MGYFEINDLLLEMSEADLARLTGDSTGAEVNEERIEYAQNMAEAIINSFLAGRYNVPFTDEVDIIIKKLSMDLTVYNLYEYAYSKSVIPDTVITRRLNALLLLKQLQTGEIHILSLKPGTNAPPPIFSNKSENDKEFSDELLDTYPGY